MRTNSDRDRAAAIQEWHRLKSNKERAADRYREAPADTTESHYALADLREAENAVRRQLAIIRTMEDR